LQQELPVSSRRVSHGDRGERAEAENPKAQAYMCRTPRHRYLGWVREEQTAGDSKDTRQRPTDGR